MGGANWQTRLLRPFQIGKKPIVRDYSLAKIPVVEVGSLSMGGTGKTPFVIALCQHLAMRGCVVNVVLPGEGAARLVNERTDRADVVGDEPLLVAAFAPCWVAKDPIAGVLAAQEAGADLVVVEEAGALGRNPSALTVLVEDAWRGLGNGLAWPVGPLKQPVSTGLAAADYKIVIGVPRATERFLQNWESFVPARLNVLQTGIEFDGMSIVAFAGITSPERFFQTLTGLGAKLVRAQALENHQKLTPALMHRLEAEALLRNAQLVTTEKDAVRLPRAFRAKVISLPVRLDVEDWTGFDEKLAQLEASISSRISVRSA